MFFYRWRIGKDRSTFSEKGGTWGNPTPRSIAIAIAMFSSIRHFLKKNDHFLLIPVLFYLPFVFMGYGADSDSFETLRTGATFINNFDYIPSRNPGYLVFEVITFFANLIGGSIATNLMSVLMSLICLRVFYQFCKTLAIPNSKYLVLSVALHPYYWVASTTTMDYIFALGFFFLGVSFLLRKKTVYAGVAFSLAIGCRLTTVLLVILALILFIVARIISFKEATVSFLFACLLAVIFYLPPLDFVKWRWWRIFKPAMGGSEYWSLFLRVGRFVYKNIMFWSAPVLLFLFGSMVYPLIKKVNIESNLYKLIVVNFLVFLTYEVLFFFVPLDPSYLLVVLPFSFIIIGILFQKRRKILIMLLLLIFLSNFIVPGFARPDVEHFATGASYGLWLEPGYLVETSRERMKVIDCVDLDCYEDRTQN